ncbi:putative permease of the drug/metabolite transporter (DMT) superfamily [Oxalobacteraceae bacterium IMCC9480]|nr:putative permease of the drug/metabolite transporter (DMT) superfamily [Oxalobacteraceae bacterium IMCC9480]NDP60695.1 DMT family transporter [Oxalobacteraceae bacterium]
MQSLWMLLATFLFAIMGVCVKLASDYYSIAEIVMARGAIGVIVIGALVLLRGDTLRTRFARHHLWRGTVGVTAFWMWFYAIATLPLSMAMTLNYMAPIWIAAILFTGGWWRGVRSFEPGMILAIMASFIGVTLLLQPAMHASQWMGALIALASGMLAALAYLQVRELGKMGEPESRVVFYFSLTSTLAGLGGVLLAPGPLADAALWHVPSTRGLLLLLAIGGCATVAQMAMTRAYRLGKILVTANLQYTGIVFSSFWGVLLWQDVLGWKGWSGIAVILSSGLVATYYNTRSISSTDVSVTSSDPIVAEV